MIPPPKWRERSKEDAWRLVDKASYKKHQSIIRKIKEDTPEIKQRYSFDDDFDLADKLIGILHEYELDKAMPPMKERLDASRQRMAEIKKTGSLENATDLETFALFFGGYRLHHEPATSVEKHDLQRAIRHVEKDDAESRRGGRYREPESTLASTLASYWYQGTGKLPATGTRGQLRGPYGRYAFECTHLLRVEITIATLRDQAWRMRRYHKNLIPN